MALKQCDPQMLEAWFDGQTSEIEAVLIRQHLARCVACRRQVHAWESLRSLAGAARNAALPEGSWERLEARLRRPATVRPSRWLPLAAAAAVGVGLLLARLMSGPEWPSQGWEALEMGAVAPSSELVAAQVPLPESQFEPVGTEQAQ